MPDLDEGGDLIEVDSFMQRKGKGTAQVFAAKKEGEGRRRGEEGRRRRRRGGGGGRRKRGGGGGSTRREEEEEERVEVKRGQVCRSCYHT